MKRNLSILIILAACGGTSSAPSIDGPPTSHLDQAKCSPFAQSFATASSTCGSPLPAGAQASFESWCKKGVTAAEMCGGNPAAGLDCFATSDANDWVCQLGYAYPACGGDLAAGLGALCLIALGNPACSSGIHCEFDSDCSGAFKCNGVTKQCMSSSAYCIGLPCEFDSDCPTQEKCNGAEHACIGR